MSRPAEMPAVAVVEIVAWLDTAGVVYQINGGWGVDGLVGRQTRPHQDLDVFIDTQREAEFMAWLTSRGYRVAEDWRPVRVELTGHLGRVDVHPMRMDPDGNGIQQGLSGEVYVHAASHRVLGRIHGHVVVVASADRVRELRSGYPLRDIDEHDLALLDQL
jgi:lincosamide nucleotidyltransferase A/C/D/E